MTGPSLDWSSSSSRYEGSDANPLRMGFRGTPGEYPTFWNGGQSGHGLV